MSLLRVFCPRFSLVACLFLLTNSGMASTPVASPTAVPQIVEHVDEGRLVTLSGNTRPEARAEFDRGRVAPNLVMGDLFLVLRRSAERQAAFDAFLASQQDSSSPNFHHWLTPDQIGQQFGPAQSDIDTINQWLQNHGFSVDEVSKDRLFIRFSGNATQVENAFHTEIHNLQVKGENHVANMSDPKIPEALTTVVVGVKALHNFFPHTLHKLGGAVRRDATTGKWQRISAPVQMPSEASPVKASSSKTVVLPQFATTGNGQTIEDVAPYDFATIYNVLPLWNANIDGTGQTIAIAGRSNINPNDVKTFRAAFGLPATLPNSTKAPYSVIVTNTDPGDCPTAANACINEVIENTLDVEWAGAIAKNASVILVTSSGTTTTSDGVFLSEQYIYSHLTAPIMNVSYGECELGLGTTGNTTYNQLWSNAQMAGIAVIVATGDSGSASCDAGGDANGVPYGAQFGLSVSGIASTPFDTAVGGTDFNWAWTNTESTYWGANDSSANESNALGYIPESPWNSTCSNSLLDASINSQLKTSDSAAVLCDKIGLGNITFGGSADPGLVDTVGGSGGKSSCINGNGSTVASCTKGYAKPSWQTALTPTDTVRDIPDVSFFAANGFSGSSYVVCVTAAGTCSYTQGSEPSGEEIGGTSVASPIMAGVMALANQKAGAAQGNPNTVLYQLAGKETYSACSSETVTASSTSCTFNDINAGTNAMPCAVGSPNDPLNDCTGTDVYGVLNEYSASAGYDLATGLGSLNVANFVNSFVSAVAPAVTLSPTSLTISATEGTTVTSQSVTVKNTGGGDDLAISSIAITTGTNANLFSLASNTCGSTLAANASCSFTVNFTPHTFGSFPASVSITDNASNSPQTVNLTGTGTEIGTYALSVTTAPPAVAPGSPGSATITATPSGNYTSTAITLTCSVAPITGGHDTPTCSAGAAIVVTAGEATGTVTVNTTAAHTLVRKGPSGSAQFKTKGWLGAGGAALACVLLFGVPARKRYWKSLLGALIFMAALGALSGCGGGGGGGTVTQTDPGTTAGAYIVTVTGTDAASVVETTTFTLTVN
jgi:subtilase family serine protease